ncbi:hypothetical protein [Nesterenkonia rhizosphaerae]|uniref:Uncharacterized protein n=1 Tax=Nesterenkonia rhizosphaerae TaxID=1348272 RepID=A0ABP9G9B7_9MICC
MADRFVYQFVAVPAFVLSGFKGSKAPNAQAFRWEERMTAARAATEDQAAYLRRRRFVIYEMSCELFGYVMLLCIPSVGLLVLLSQVGRESASATIVLLGLLGALSFSVGMIFTFALKLWLSERDVKRLQTMNDASKEQYRISRFSEPSNWDFAWSMLPAVAIFGLTLLGVTS